MKVLQINAVYGIGSTGRITQELDLALKENRIQSKVAASVSNVPEADYYSIGNLLDRKLHALLSRLTGKQAYFSKVVTFKLLRYIEKEKYDIVHLGNLHGNYIHLPMLLKFLAKKDIATVMTLHDCWFFTGKCTHYIDFGCYKWLDRCGNCPKLKKDNASWFFDRTERIRADRERLFKAIPRLAVVGVSDWITNEAKKSFLGNAAVLQRIYNWIDTDVFQPSDVSELKEKLKLKSNPIVLGVSHYWTDTKGLSTFVALAKRMPEVQFVMVGNMPKTAELPDNILSVGLVSDPKELAQYYSLADVFLNPSLYETFGKTTAEAMSCGTPVIGFRSTAIPEVIGENGGIILDVDDDIVSIENAIRHILNKTKEFYTKNCRMYVVENFEKEKVIEEHIQLYRSLLNQ